MPPHVRATALVVCGCTLCASPWGMASPCLLDSRAQPQLFPLPLGVSRSWVGLSGRGGLGRDAAPPCPSSGCQTHCSGGWKSKVAVPADPASGEDSSWLLDRALSLRPLLMRTQSYRLGPHPMTHLTLITLKVPVSKYSPSWGLGLQPVNFGRTQTVLHTLVS